MKYVKTFGTFSAICAMGFVIALSGGAVWGCRDTGLLTTTIFIVASFLSVAVWNLSDDGGNGNG